MKIVITGGGTGGHLFPALAIGTEWQKRHPEGDVHYIGSLYGIEADLFQKNNVSYSLLPIRGLQRGFSRRSIGRNILLPGRLMLAYLEAKSILQSISPNVVVGTGGYASALPVKIALKRNIPVVLQEQNSTPGLTTRMFAGKAKRVCLGFESASEYLAQNAIFTGNPIRIPEVKSEKKDAFNHYRFSENKPVVLLLGGSQGSAVLNQIMQVASEAFTTYNIQVLWQVGNRNYESYNKYDSNLIRVVPFIDDMQSAYNVSDVIVSRAGAIALAEISAWGKPSVLIPLPSAAGDHQRKNAQTMVQSGASIMLEEKECSAEHLFHSVNDILQDTKQLAAMRDAASALGNPHATDRIVDIIDEVAQG